MTLDVEQLQKAVKYLAGVCDGAVEKDGQGFNGRDTEFGHSLANQEKWTVGQANAAKNMLRTYNNQLKRAGIEIDFDVKDIKDSKGLLRAKVGPTLQFTEQKPSKLLLKCKFEDNPKAKSVGRCRFNGKEKGWEYELDSQVVRKLKETFSHLNMSIEVNNWFQEEESKRQAIIAAKNSEDAELQVAAAEKLYPFQRVGCNFLRSAKRALLADDMGLGKTVQTIVACEEVKAEKILIICPNTLKSNWKREIEKWTPERNITILRGSTREKKNKVISEFETGYFVANFESIRRGKEKKEVDGETKLVLRDDDFVDRLMAIEWDVVIIDEAHNIKNRKAQQTKDTMVLAKQAKHLFLLTGTPIMNKVDELWSLLNTMYPEKYTSFWKFVKKFANAYPGRWGWVIEPHPKNPSELRKELEPFFLRREKEQVFVDLPRKTYQQIWVELEGKQKKIYDQMEAEAMAEVEEGDTVIAPGILAKITRCKQIAISAELINGSKQSAKLDALKDVITGTDKKLVIFSQFAEAVKIISKMLDEMETGYVTFTGKTKEDQRQDAIDKFQNDENTKVFLATTQAGGVGVNLTAASYVVLLDKHWTPAVNEQAVDRVHRHGQKNPVTVIEVLAQDTVDEMIEEVLAGKKSIVEAVISRKKGVK